MPVSNSLSSLRDVPPHQDGDDYSFVDFEPIEDAAFFDSDDDDEDVYVPPNVLRRGAGTASLVDTEGFVVTLDDPGTTVLVAEGGRPGMGSKAMAAAAKKGKYRSQVLMLVLVLVPIGYWLRQGR